MKSLRRYGLVDGWMGLMTLGFVGLLLVQFFYGLSYSTFLLLPKFLTLELHAGPTTVGAVMAASSLSIMASAPFVGELVDRWGRCACVVTGCALGGVASLGFLAVSQITPFLFALRLLQGLALTLVFGGVGAWVTDIVSWRQLGQATGLFCLAMDATNALGPIVVEPMGDAGHWRVTFVLGAVAALLAVPWPVGIRWRSGGMERRAGRGPAPSWRYLLRNRGLVLALAAGGLAGGANGAMFAFHAPFALQRGASQVRDFLVGYTVGVVVSRLLFGHLVDRASRSRVAAGTLVFYGATVLAMIVLSARLLFPLGVGFGFAQGLMYPAVSALAVERAGPQGQGKVVTLFFGAFNAGVALGVPALGLLAEVWGFAPMFTVASAACLVAGLALSVLREENQDADAQQRRSNV